MVFGRHFFTCSAVSELKIDQKPTTQFADFIEMLKFSCSRGEWARVKVLRSFFDLMNLQAFLYKKSLDPYGNIPSEHFEEHVRDHLELPTFIIDYLVHYPNPDDQKEHFPALVAQFFDARKKIKGFVGAFFAWLEEFFIVGGTIRAKRLGRDIAKELSHEDFSHPLVLEGLAQREAMSYEPPPHFAALKEIYERDFEGPQELEKNTSNFIFQHLEAVKEEKGPGLDFLLAYMIQLVLVEHLWPEKAHHFDLEALIAS